MIVDWVGGDSKSTNSPIVFLPPNILTLMALPPKIKLRKTTLATLALWCFLIVVGVISMEQEVYVKIFCAVLFAINVVSFFGCIQNQIWASSASQVNASALS